MGDVKRLRGRAAIDLPQRKVKDGASFPSPQEEPTLQAPLCGTSSPQTWEAIHFCHSNHLVCGTFITVAPTNQYALFHSVYYIPGALN